MTTLQDSSGSLGDAVEQQRGKLLELHSALAALRGEALTPAIDRALELAELHLFLALTYVGHTGELFPGQHPATTPG
jgi:hypothetical protein